MRHINYIVIHCTANRLPCQPYTQKQTVINEFKRKGWRRPGYHMLVTTDGEIHELLETTFVAYGVAGYNANSIHIAYYGGLSAFGQPCDTRTPAQRESLDMVVSSLMANFPDALLLGHRDFSDDVNGNGIVDSWERIKECPCFDVAKEWPQYWRGLPPKKSVQ